MSEHDGIEISNKPTWEYCYTNDFRVILIPLSFAFAKLHNNNSATSMSPLNAQFNF